MIMFLRLLSAIASVGHGIGAALNGLANLVAAGSLALYLHAAPADIEALRNWLRGIPQQPKEVPTAQPLLTPESELLFVELQRLFEIQYQLTELQRELLTLPARPDEGY
jgi:hypothetical protein